MTYVFDTSSFIVLSHYYKDQFPSVWKRVNNYVKNGKIISVKEVLNEIESYGLETELKKWVKHNKNIFQTMSRDEGLILSNIFKQYPRFQNMVSKKEQLIKKPFADPFVVVKAMHIKEQERGKGIVVSEESSQKNGIKIPNLCKVKGVTCLKLREFMKKEKWSF